MNNFRLRANRQSFMRKLFVGLILLSSIYSATANADSLCRLVTDIMKRNPGQSEQFISAMAEGFVESQPELAKRTAIKIASELFAYCTSNPDGDGTSLLAAAKEEISLASLKCSAITEQTKSGQGDYKQFVSRFLTSMSVAAKIEFPKQAVDLVTAEALAYCASHPDADGMDAVMQTIMKLTAAKTTPPAPTPLDLGDVEPMNSSYASNQAAFARDYVGRRFSSKMIVVHITQNIFFKDLFSVFLGNTKLHSQVQCSFSDKKYVAEIAEMHDGYCVNISGIVNDHAFGVIALKECTIETTYC